MISVNKFFKANDNKNYNDISIEVDIFLSIFAFQVVGKDID